jgi:DNA polymerase elongation subunit (family B)
MNYYTSVHTLGNKILSRGIDDSGKDFIRREIFKPTMFVPGKTGDTPYKTLEGEKVYPIQPGSMKETKDFIRDYSNVGGFKVYGIDQFDVQYICDKWNDTIEFDPTQIRTYNIDIEVESGEGFPHPEQAASVINAITIYDNTLDTYFTWGLEPWCQEDGEYADTDIKIVYEECDDEVELLKSFLDFWQKTPPHIVTGWNIEGFDIPYIMNRYAKIFGVDETKKFSPFGWIRERKVKTKFGKEQVVYDMYGIQCLDYIQLYRKFTYKLQESYKLDWIAHVELGENKLSYEEEGSLFTLSRVNYQKFIDYNIKDVELVKRLDDKMKLIDLTLTMAYDAKINYQDVFGTVKQWDAIIYDYLKQQNIVAPPKNHSHKDEKYIGAYVKTPILGKHEWIVSFDLNSLYPHLIMNYNISPETIVGFKSGVTVDSLLNKEVDLSELKRDNTTVAPNGTVYTRNKRGFLPDLMEKIYKERKVFKGKMLDAEQRREDGDSSTETVNDIAKFNNIQMAKKIQLNSAYGAVGNQYFRYYDLRNAEAITTGGQLAIKWIEKKLNAYLNDICKTEDYDYVVAIDTDSVYLRLNKIVEGSFKGKSPTKEDIVNFLDKVSQKAIEPFIDKSYEELADYVNAYEQKMQMGREAISDTGLWTAKKRYALNVYDNEGVRYAEPKMKVMGLEIVKSSTPSNVRDKLKESVKIILTGNEVELQQLVTKYREEFNNLPIEDISFPRGLNEYKKYLTQEKSVPIHVRGSILFNKLLDNHGLKNIEKIDAGTKVKFAYLKLPNKYHQNVISFVGGLPKEFDMSNLIDYDIQFQKTYLNPLEGILQPIGWEWERKSSLDSFF